MLSSFFARKNTYPSFFPLVNARHTEHPSFFPNIFSFSSVNVPIFSFSASPSQLDIGDIAPDFTLSTATSGDFSLHNFIETSNNDVVLFFFPKINTPICSRENAHFSNQIEKFKKLDTTLVGISHKDSVSELNQYATENEISHILLSDIDGKVHNLYNSTGIVSHRKTFVIDSFKKIIQITNNPFSPYSHADNALSTLQNGGEKENNSKKS